MELIQYEAIKSNDEEIWSNAIDSLVSEHSEKALNSLLDALSDRSWKKRESAANAIINWNVPNLSSLLAKHLSTSNIDKFYWVLRILGHISDETSINLIQSILQQQDSEIRGYATQALG